MRAKAAAPRDAWAMRSNAARVRAIGDLGLALEPLGFSQVIVAFPHGREGL